MQTDGMSRRELLPWLCGLPLVGGLLGWLGVRKADASVDGGGCPLDSDLDYVDAREYRGWYSIVPYLNGRPVHGVVRGSASEGWLEAFSGPDAHPPVMLRRDGDFGPRRFRGEVRFRVVKTHAEGKRLMRGAEYLW